MSAASHALKNEEARPFKQPGPFGASIDPKENTLDSVNHADCSAISRSFSVSLEWYEVEIARYVGHLRQESAEKRGLHDRHHTPTDGQACHESGALAEVAAAKALDLYWTGSVDTFSTGADVSDRVQVRWTSYPNGHLIVHGCDRDTDAFVLVTGSGTTYTLRGWTFGAEAKRIGHVKDNGDRWVRQADLYPMPTLREVLP